MYKESLLLVAPGLGRQNELKTIVKSFIESDGHTIVGEVDEPDEIREVAEKPTAVIIYAYGSPEDVVIRARVAKSEFDEIPVIVVGNTKKPYFVECHIEMVDLRNAAKKVALTKQLKRAIIELDTKKQ